MKKTRALNTCSKHNIPLDLWREILSRLPAKSLLQFRCVSRSWQALIDDPDFTHLHLTRFNNNLHSTHLFLCQSQRWDQGKERECVARCSNTFRTTAKLGTLRTSSKLGTLRTSPRLGGNPRTDTRIVPAYDGERDWYVFSSIDGLFMLVNCCLRQTPVFMLWNPSIRKVRSIPYLTGIPQDKQIVNFCLGFDPVNKDYKYVRLLLTDCSQIVDVYSVGTDSWKKVELSSKWRRYFALSECGGNRPSVHLRGVLYFIDPRGPNLPLYLVAFDLSSNTLDSTSLLYEFKLPFKYPKLTLVDGGSLLAVVILAVEKDAGSIWVLQRTEDDGSFSSWTKRYTFHSMIRCHHFTHYPSRLLYLKKNGEALLDWGNMVTSYNLETHEENIILRSSLYRHDESVYIESLILLK